MRLIISAVLITLVTKSQCLTAEDLDQLSDEEYSKLALEELKAINQSRFLSDLHSPYCKIYTEEDAAECYLKFRWMKIPRVVAVRIDFDNQKLALGFGLFFDDDLLFEYRNDIAKICVPLPAKLKYIDICFHAYYVDIDTQLPALSFDVCFLLTLADVLHLKLNCVRMDKDAEFIHHAEHQPEHEGIVVLTIEDGNLKFKLNNPIPQEVMDEIEKQWKIFEKDAQEAFDVAGRELQKVGKDIETTFTQFGKDVEEGWYQASERLQKFGEDAEVALTQFGKDVEAGWSQAGQELNKFGEDVEKGYNKFSKDVEKFGKSVKKKVKKFGKKFKKKVKKFGKNVEKVFDDIGNAFKNFFG